ncbi:MAG: hypothetical protein AAB600_05235 [Patescibacteria group bacterium]
MTFPKELTTVTRVSRIVAVIVLTAVMVIGFGLGITYQETIDLLKKQNSSAPVTVNKHTNSPQINNPYTLSYEHPKLHYIVSYQSDWIRTIPDYPGIYEDFIIHSPIFERGSGTYASIIKGSEISITVGKSSTPLKTIDDFFDGFQKSISTNIKHTTVDNQPAIRFDEYFEGANFTGTVFLYKNLLYLVTIYFPITDASRTTNLDVYEFVLGSLLLPR